MGERKAKTGGVDPSLAQLAQSTDGVLLMQSCRQTVDRGKITALDKTVTFLDRRQAFAPGLAFDPLVAVQDQLRAERGIAAHADRHMTPFAIHDVKIVMLDERPVLAVADFCNLPSGIAFDFPDRRRRIASDQKEQAAKCRILGHLRRGQLVLSLPGYRLDDWNLLLCAERMQAAGECACHLAQMLVIQLRVVPVQVSPPAAHAAAGLPHWEKGIEDDAIHAIVDPLQQLGVVLRKVVARIHARSLARFAAVSGSCSRKRTSLFQ